MVWTKANAALRVYLLMIPAQRLDQTNRCRLIKMHAGEHTSCRLDTHSSRTLALVWNDQRFKLGLCQSTLKAHIVNLVIGRAVMRQNTQHLAITLLAHPRHMRGQGLTN